MNEPPSSGLMLRLGKRPKRAHNGDLSDLRPPRRCAAAITKLNVQGLVSPRAPVPLGAGRRPSSGFAVMELRREGEVSFV